MTTSIVKLGVIIASTRQGRYPDTPTKIETSYTEETAWRWSEQARAAEAPPM